MDTDPLKMLWTLVEMEWWYQMACRVPTRLSIASSRSIFCAAMAEVRHPAWLALGK